MEFITIKEYGGEVKFTTDVCRNEDWSRKLLEAVDYFGEFQMQFEVPTADSKRIDLVATDMNENTLFAIECQDATGYLDPVHASKIMLYCFDRGTRDGVIICEDIEENIRDFVKDINATSEYKIYIVKPIIVKNDKEILVDFTPVMRPYNTKQKAKVDRNKKSVEDSQESYAKHQAIFDAYPDLFNTSAKFYVSMQNVGKHRVNVNVVDRPTEWLLGITQKAKPVFENEDKQNTKITKAISEYTGMEWKSNSVGPYFNFKKDSGTLDDAIQIHKKVLEGFSTDSIV